MARGPLRLMAAAWLTGAACVLGCGRAPVPTAPALAPTPGVPWFEDATDRSRVRFVSFDSATPAHYIPEVMGGGVGWIDYDNDGWPDLFCVQVGPIRPSGEGAPPPPTHYLYRNRGDGTFEEVSRVVGLDKSGFGMGCAVGDFNNDGFDDLVVTYLDRTALYENRPDGKGGRRFEDVTKAAGIDNPNWGTSCAWGDIDGDGRLDLYICNYVRIDLNNYTTCTNTDVNQVYVCPPTVFPVVSHKLYRNRGDGTFEDITASSGVAAVPPAAGLGVVILDLDGDGKQDLYVANDMGAAHLLHNQGGGKFVDRGLRSGTSLMPGGRFMAGMGVAVGDVDGSGRPSLMVANYQNEPTMLFLNRGNLIFNEWSHASGLGPATRRTLGFGIELFDADLDGHLDVALANGHVVRNSVAIFKAPYEQEAQLLLGDGTGKFREVSDKAGRYFGEKRVGRGLAACDYDNDGRPDLVFNHIAGPLKLLRNATENGNHWVRLDLSGNGSTSNRNAIGARVEIEAGGRKQVRFVHGGGSYLSASDRRLSIGLGAAEKVDRVAVVWPDGKRQEYRDLAADRAWKLVQDRAGAEPAALAK